MSCPYTRHPLFRDESRPWTASSTPPTNSTASPSRRHDLLVYQPDVRVFEVFNSDGSAVGLGLARDNKFGGAWSNGIVDQSLLLGLTVIDNPQPAPGYPALRTFDELRTMFHEFGNALHGPALRSELPLAGTSVPRDLVEFPSQFNEMGARDRKVFLNSLGIRVGNACPALPEAIQPQVHDTCNLLSVKRRPARCAG